MVVSTVVSQDTLPRRAFLQGYIRATVILGKQMVPGSVENTIRIFSVRSGTAQRQNIQDTLPRRAFLQGYIRTPVILGKKWYQVVAETPFESSSKPLGAIR